MRQSDEWLADAVPGFSLLIVPGLGNSGPDHWQTLWENALPGARRADLGAWDRPTPTQWDARLDMAIGAAARDGGRPVILIAHSLGCIAAARWGEARRNDAPVPVAGALLVAPPDLDHCAELPELASLAPFAPAPDAPLPFPSILVASRDDPYCPLPGAQALAARWGSQFVDAGAHGHINAASGLGRWDAGLMLLRDLVERAETAAAKPEGRKEN